MTVGREEVEVRSQTQTYNQEKKERFSEFIKEKRMYLKNPSTKKPISTKELAERVGIDYELFRKILNMNKPTKKRDCIIAICASLKLDSEETNEALKRYNYMPILNTEDERDDYIIDILEEQLSHYLSIDEINNRLVRNEFPELDIIDRRSSDNRQRRSKDSRFKLLKKISRTRIDEMIYRNQFDSLEYEYSISKYHCIAEMWLEDSVNKEKCHLSADTNDSYLLTRSNKDLYDIKAYHNTDDSGIFKDFFLELKAMANRERKKMLNVLNDTKNYHIRIGAGIKDDDFYVYIESYNYLIPELDEYCLLEQIGGECILSVYENSEFMHCYLSKETYEKQYGKKPNKLIASYRSMDELKEMENATNNSSRYILKSRIKVFETLLNNRNTIIADIRNRNKFVRNLDHIYDDKDRVCEFFGVEKEYNCFYDKETGDMLFASDNSHSFNFDDCGTVELTLEDLYQAFELGFSNINQICRVKKRKGSIKKIIS